MVDFGAGYTVQDDPALSERVRQALAPHPNVVLLLPCVDADQSIACLNERVDQDRVDSDRVNPDRVDAELRDLNAHYVRHPANGSLAKVCVYTLGKTPEETCEDILCALGIAPL